MDTENVYKLKAAIRLLEIAERKAEAILQEALRLIALIK